MAEEYWKTSLFGADSYFAPGWDEKQRERRKTVYEGVKIVQMVAIPNYSLQGKNILFPTSPMVKPNNIISSDASSVTVAVTVTVKLSGKADSVKVALNKNSAITASKSISSDFQYIANFNIRVGKALAPIDPYNSQEFTFTATVIDIFTKNLSDTRSEKVKIDTKGTVWGVMAEKCKCDNGITESDLKQIAESASRANIQRHLVSLNLAMTNNGINNCLRKIHMLAQILHESGSLNYTKEIGASESSYGGFPGRGLIQLTGKSTYLAYQKYSGEDVTSNAQNKQKLENPPDAALSAGWFWIKTNLNYYADNNDFIMITRLINGGYNGYNDRLKFISKGITALAKNCDEKITSDYKFNKSAAYTETRACFAWGLWHDPEINKSGCTKNKQDAIEGYQQFMNIIPEDFEEYNWYGIKSISAFQSIKESNESVSVKKAVLLRLEELKI